MVPAGSHPPPEAAAYFASDYFGARLAFLEAAAHAGAQTRAYSVSARGPRGEELFIDSARLGASKPARLLILTSGVHGIEGFAGSALQRLFLERHADQWRQANDGVLLVHALNPYGFAHGRRVNENNVDLNRNALDHFPGPDNAAYRSLNRWLNPSSLLSRFDDFWPGALWHSLRLGPSALRQAIAGGQYEFPQGLFYGGSEPEGSLRIFSQLLTAPEFTQVETIVHLDLHSGLGKFARLHLYVDHAPGSAAFQRWQDSYGTDRVTSSQTTQSGGYPASGVLSDITRRIFAGREVLTATLEAGTCSAVRVLRALRAENRAQFHDPAAIGRARVALCQAFYPPENSWRQALVTQGHWLLSRLDTLCAC
jgi:predicted deacylase